MRILHLVAPGSPGSGPCTLRLLAQATRGIHDADHDVFVIGTAAAVSLARRCGLTPLGSLSAPLNDPALGRRGLHRFVRVYESARGSFNVVHVWSLSAVTLLTGSEIKGARRWVSGPGLGHPGPRTPRRCHAVPPAPTTRIPGPGGDLGDPRVARAGRA